MEEKLLDKISRHMEFNGMLGDLINIEGCILAGGAVRDVYMGVKPKDYDFFFTSEEAISQALFAMREFPSVGNYYTHSYDMGGIKIQLVTKRCYLNAEEIISSFDFTPTQLAFDGSEVSQGVSTLADIKERKVGINVITKPLDSLIRLERYLGERVEGVLINEWNIEHAYQHILDVMKGGNPRVILNVKKYDFE